MAKQMDSMESVPPAYDPAVRGDQDAPQGAALARLIYRSRSILAQKSSDPESALEIILQHARHNNERAGLTGVLLFDGEIFVQALEGTLCNIERVYEAIACDQRHEGLELIDLSIVERRDYPDWTMAFLDATNTQHQELRCFMANPTRAASASLGGGLFDIVHDMLPMSQPHPRGSSERHAAA